MGKGAEEWGEWEGGWEKVVGWKKGSRRSRIAGVISKDGSQDQQTCFLQRHKIGRKKVSILDCPARDGGELGAAVLDSLGVGGLHPSRGAESGTEQGVNFGAKTEGRILQTEFSRGLEGVGQRGRKP